MKGGIGQLMKQAQQMQENLQRAQEELGRLEVTGASGGGMVEVTMTCRHQVQGVRIDDSLVGDDKEMLEDLIAAACNDAARKVEAKIQEKFASLGGGMGLPSGLKLPF